MTRVFLGLGSNLGDRVGHLRAAVESLGPSVVGLSPVYETAPVGGPAGQGAYLNMVAVIETDLTARQLLSVCWRLETASGRVRSEHWGPRTLDVDILLFGDDRIDEPDLCVPHPRLWERNFVVRPLLDLEPSLRGPGGAVAEGHVTIVGQLADLPREAGPGVWDGSVLS